MFRLLVLAVLAVAALPASAQVTYTLIDLGVLTGTDATVAGIASGGRVAIASESAGRLRSSVWQSGTTVGLGTLGGTTAYAHGISFNTSLGATQVVGSSLNAAAATRASASAGPRSKSGP